MSRAGAAPTRKIALTFVRGVERGRGHMQPPDYVVRAGLAHRFAVIQEVYVPGHADPYLDQVLWKHVVAFCASYAGRDAGAELFAARAFGDVVKREIPIAAFEAEWEAATDDDREPAAGLILRVGRAGGTMLLCMLSEFWTQLGGAFPYADNYAYSFFAARDVGEELVAFLHASPDAARWAFPERVLEASETEKMR